MFLVRARLSHVRSDPGLGPNISKQIDLVNLVEVMLSQPIRAFALRSGMAHSNPSVDRLLKSPHDSVKQGEMLWY